MGIIELKTTMEKLTIFFLVLMLVTTTWGLSNSNDKHFEGHDLVDDDMLTKAQHDSRSGNLCSNYWYDSKCKNLANMGKCSKDSNVKKFCKKTCNLCGCSDNFASCKYYADKGYCKTNDKMKVDCKYSCNFCEGSTTTTTQTTAKTTPKTITTTGSCEDKKSHCKINAAKGIFLRWIHEEKLQKVLWSLWRK